MVVTGRLPHGDAFMGRSSYASSGRTASPAALAAEAVSLCLPWPSRAGTTAICLSRLARSATCGAGSAKMESPLSSGLLRFGAESRRNSTVKDTRKRSGHRSGSGSPHLYRHKNKRRGSEIVSHSSSCYAPLLNGKCPVSELRDKTMRIGIVVLTILWSGSAFAEPFESFVLKLVPVCPSTVKPVYPPSYIVWGAGSPADTKRRAEWLKKLTPIPNTPCKIILPGDIAVCDKYYCHKFSEEYSR